MNDVTCSDPPAAAAAETICVSLPQHLQRINFINYLKLPCEAAVLLLKPEIRSECFYDRNFPPSCRVYLDYLLLCHLLVTLN